MSGLLAAAPARAATVESVMTFAGGPLQNQFTYKIAPPISPFNTVATKTGYRAFKDDLLPDWQVQQFDPGLGTLQSVKVTYAFVGTGENSFKLVDIDCSLVLDKLSGCDARRLNSKARIRRGIDLDFGNSYNTVEIVQQTLNNNYGDLQGAGSTARTYTGDMLAPFIGTGQYVLSPYTWLRIDSNMYCRSIWGLRTCSGTSRIKYASRYEATVTYVYDDGTPDPGAQVPLPAGLPLLSGALALGFGIGRRRRR